MSVSLIQPPLDAAALNAVNRDAWDCGAIFGPTEALVVGSRYVGHLPRSFRASGGLRLSIAEITGGQIEFQMAVGNGGALLFAGTQTWSYTSGVDSILFPASLFQPWAQNGPLPAGARMALSITNITGVAYGQAFKGLRAAFLGAWE